MSCKESLSLHGPSSRSSTPATQPRSTRRSPFSFSQIIDDDHMAINTYAGRLKNATTVARRRELLFQVLWRLVRHDVSEDIVMRPAFMTHLGDLGRTMAETDRSDHDRAKAELLALLQVPIDSDQFMREIDRLFNELLEHMRVESGQEIPQLESVLSKEESHRLGRLYLQTQVITPDLVVRGPDGVPRRLFEDVEDYARTDLSTFKAIWDRLPPETWSDNGATETTSVKKRDKGSRL